MMIPVKMKTSENAKKNGRWESPRRSKFKEAEFGSMHLPLT